MRKPIFALLLAAAAACGDSTSANYPSLVVRTSTTGASQDPDGYVLAIVRAGASPGYFPQRLARNGLFSAPACREPTRSGWATSRPTAAWAAPPCGRSLCATAIWPIPSGST